VERPTGGRIAVAASVAAPRDVGAVAAVRSDRVVFLDLARVAAVLAMVQGHTLHALLDPALRAGPVYDVWVVFRGFTSPSFLLLSGACFAVATLKRWDENVRPSGAVGRRLARFAGFVLLGYALHFPVSDLRDLATVSQARWDGFLQVDVLQAIGVSLLLLQGLVLATRTPRRFGWACAGIAVALFFATGPVHSVDWHRHLPAPLAAYLHLGRGSPFPLVGWAFFPLLGAALAVAFRRLDAVAPTTLALGLATVAALLLAVSWVLAGSPGTLCLAPWSPVGCPDFFLWRLIGVALLLAAVVWLVQGRVRLPRPLRAVAEESLVVYFVHLCVVYGSIWGPGLRSFVGPTQGVAGALTWAALVIAWMVLLAWAWNGFKRRHPRGTHLARAAIVVAMILLV